MATNFDFLKKVDTNLFEIISEAEKLYRDEYFEQCMGQTRRFGENVCKKVLGANRTVEKTFDDMLATLKDCSTGEDVEKEFIDDLYFLKMEALECLQRAFEVAINYSVYNRSASSNILKLRYDTELLITGKKKEKSLAEKYTEAKKQTTKKTTTKSKAKKNTTNKKKFQKQSSVMVCKAPKKRISLYWIFVGISCIISLTIVLGMIIALHVK